MRVGLACCAKRAQSEDRYEPVHEAGSLDCKGHRAPVAHRIERSAPDRKAAGSIPAGRTKTRIQKGAPGGDGAATGRGSRTRLVKKWARIPADSTRRLT